METLKNADQSSDGLDLNLSLRLPSPPPPPPPPFPSQQSKSFIIPQSPAPPKTQNQASSSHASSSSGTANHSQPNPKRRRKKANDMAIEAPYPWSTEHRAVVRDLEYLRSNGILTISGDVKCKQCNRQYLMEYDLVKKFNEVASFIERNRDTFHDRAPNSWLSPPNLNCELCKKEKCVEPLIPDEEEDEEGDENYNKINWLFLLLGQLIGRLKLKQLKYFCAHTNHHRTGAKNRLVCLVYFALCKQLQPFNRLFNHR